MGSLPEKLLRPFMGKKKHYTFWQKMYKASLMGMNIGNGAGFDESGEKWAMEYVRDSVIKTEAPVLFDVGANVGGYANMLLDYFPGATVHCFEPAGVTFQTLSANVRSGRAVLNHFGMSDVHEKACLWSEGDNSGLASLYNRGCFDHSKPEEIWLDTLDHYCEQNGIGHIDFLKMDIEGNELKALQGGRGILSQGKVDVIQMEFGGCNIDSRTFFRDFWEILHESYHVYRVLLDGLWEIEEYGDILELFFCTNYLFIKKG